jgi:protein-tyrosine-phosphatase
MAEMTPTRMARLLDQQVDRLAEDFQGTYGRETVRRAVQEAAETLADATVKDFVPILAGRLARDLLKEGARGAGNSPRSRPVVMFVCVHNAGRSQMAVGLTRLLGGDRVEVRSAGTSPGDRVHPGVVESMKEAGVDLEGERPRGLEDEEVRLADVVITMGCGDACPVYLGRRYEDWEVEDPAGKTMEAVRPIRDEIRRRVEDLLARLAAGIPPGR